MSKQTYFTMASKLLKIVASLDDRSFVKEKAMHLLRTTG